MVEQWSPKPRAEGSSPSAPAKSVLTALAVGADFVSVIGLEAEARNVPGNSAERARWAKQRGGVGAAVEKDEERAVKATEVFFGHRKRGCEATSSPSAIFIIH